MSMAGAALRWIWALLASLTLFAVPVHSHPHVFVDGGVDFVLGDGSTLEALRVTWLYDEFETLYILSSNGLSLTPDGGLNEEDRQSLTRLQSDLPSDFAGSAHLSVAGEPVALGRPKGLDADIVDGRLHVTFTRDLLEPLDLRASTAEVAFYEATYFYAFAVTDTPQLEGDALGCAATVIPFDPDTQDTALQAALAKLSREETPDAEEIGAFFADRIVLQCA